MLIKLKGNQKNLKKKGHVNCLVNYREAVEIMDLAVPAQGTELSTEQIECKQFTCMTAPLIHCRFTKINGPPSSLL